MKASFEQPLMAINTGRHIGLIVAKMIYKSAFKTQQ